PNDRARPARWLDRSGRGVAQSRASASRKGAACEPPLLRWPHTRRSGTGAGPLDIDGRPSLVVRTGVALPAHVRRNSPAFVSNEETIFAEALGKGSASER